MATFLDKVRSLTSVIVSTGTKDSPTDQITLDPAVGITMAGAALLFAESATDTITASTTQTQAGATALTSEVNRVTTVANSGDAVKLPASKAGLTIMVINHGTKPMTVFGAGSDKIDDNAAATGVVQMAGSVCFYTCATAGNYYSEGIGGGYSGSLPTLSYTDGITALAGGAQAGTALTTVLNRVTTVATGGDSVQLPVSNPGLVLTVINAAASNSMNVFAQTGDTIDAIAANSPRAVAANKTATFTCTVAGKWHSLLTA